MGEKLTFDLQLNAAGPQTVILKFGSTTKYSVTLQNAGDGVLLQDVEDLFTPSRAAEFLQCSLHELDPQLDRLPTTA